VVAVVLPVEVLVEAVVASVLEVVVLAAAVDEVCIHESPHNELFILFFLNILNVLI
jgi:hypothetical protein